MVDFNTADGKDIRLLIGEKVYRKNYETETWGYRVLSVNADGKATLEGVSTLVLPSEYFANEAECYEAMKTALLAKVATIENRIASLSK